tara:strand:+ start:435 stop:683 length:249 start_codon:yes stop_codon:yes gene_type:complete
LKEYLVNEYIFKNLKPELVEKNDPPIITRIKYIILKFFSSVSRDIPIFDILLTNDKKLLRKLLSKLKKIKKNVNIIKKYKNK